MSLEGCEAGYDSPFAVPRHNWRLWSRERKDTERGPDLGPITFWREVWYCTKCRVIEERDVYDPE